MALAVLFLGMVSRFWHPYYGFTRFIQMDESDERVAVSAVKSGAVFVYAGSNGYDGATYAQIAVDPSLRDRELPQAIQNLPYRARRILTSFVAWTVAGGRPAAIAPTYAALNIAVWLALALVGWRLLRVDDARSFAVWAGFLCSAGVLHSVRLALTDAFATLLFAWALTAAERGRWRWGAAVLGVAGLARESILATALAFVPPAAVRARRWRELLFAGVVVCAPLSVWLVYVTLTVGNAGEGWGNFSAPLVGLFGKLKEVVTGLDPREPWWLLRFGTAISFVALLSQAAYVLRHRDLEDRWWRSALGGLAMMACFGTAVWEGNPGAATRVLLPLSLAVAVLIVRRRSGWHWVVLTNLTVLSGVLAFVHVPRHANEFTAGRAGGLGYVAELRSGWYGREEAGRHFWTWTAGGGEIAMRTTAGAPTAATLTLRLRALSPRRVTLRVNGLERWAGEVGTEAIPVTVPVQATRTLRLELASEAAPVTEGARADARLLGFAVYDLGLAAAR
ncbi:hypothetical protein DB354_20490 [Opitutus sp. ER46]|nr:hypothetical protein DB354_20490 [Opitutus sp. ER46]